MMTGALKDFLAEATREIKAGGTEDQLAIARSWAMRAGEATDLAQPEATKEFGKPIIDCLAGFGHSRDGSRRAVYGALAEGRRKRANGHDLTGEGPPPLADAVEHQPSPLKPSILRDQKGGAEGRARKPLRSAKPKGKDRAELLKAELRGRELDVLRWLGIAWPPERKATHINCPLPGHTDNNASWRWNSRRCGWICTCGNGDLIALVREMKGVEFGEACDLLDRDILGREIDDRRDHYRAKMNGARAFSSSGNRSAADAGNRESQSEKSADSEQSDDEAREPENAADVEAIRLASKERWGETESIAGSLGQRYFEEHRGLVAHDWKALHHVVRFHPRMRCTELGEKVYLPAIIFRIAAAPDGDLVTVFRIFLAEDGSKAAIDHPKMAYSAYKGGGVLVRKARCQRRTREGRGPRKRARLLLGGLSLRRLLRSGLEHG